MTKAKLYMLIGLFMVFGARAFGQEWEFVRTFDDNDPIRPNCMQSMTELESGDIIVNASWTDPAVNGIRSENPGLMKFSSDGTLQKEVYWSRFGYRSDDQYIIESPDHNIIVMGHFLPDRDPDCANFVLDGSDKAYLYFYKMDSDLNMIDSIEYLIPLDTTNNAAFYQAGTWGTTFLSCLIDHVTTKTSAHDAFLQEMTENSGKVVILHRKEAVTDDYDMTALRSPASFTDDGIIWAYTRDRGLWRDHDSWIMIEKLNRDFGLEREVYYPYQERTNLNCNSYIVCRDGGVLLLSYCHELDNTNVNHYILTKFPAEAFVGIEEAHDNGLKVAIAYPNPGNNVLNIRTGLRDAWMEVYDTNGRLIHSQALTENVTGINATNWTEGVYVWKVMVSGRDVETGKWMKL